jgi:hypothetical protein
MKPDPYEYIRSYYGVPAYVGVRVTIGGRTGTVVPRKAGDGAYLYVLFDGDAKPRGPYHPTEKVIYKATGLPAVDTSVTHP